MATLRFHARVAGEVHPTHAAFAKLVEKDVLVDDQPIGLTVVDTFGLELGKPFLLNQRRGQLLRVSRFRVEAIPERTNIVTRHQAAVG